MQYNVRRRSSSAEFNVSAQRPTSNKQYSTKGVTILLITALLWTTSIHIEAVFHSATSVSVSVSLSDYWLCD